MTVTTAHPVRTIPVLAAPGQLPALGVQFHGLWSFYWNGVTPNATMRAHLATLRASAVRVLRVDVGWSGSQPHDLPPDPNSHYNRRLATLIETIHEYKMQILLTVHQSAEWARPGTDDPRKTDDENKQQYPTHAATIGPWLSWLARRFGGQVLGIEIWNEPNLDDYTGVKNRAQQVTKYTDLLRVAHTAIRSVSDVPVVFGGPSSIDDEFLSACYRAGAKSRFDVAAVHPYQGDQTADPYDRPPAPEYARYRMIHLPAVRRVMAANRDVKPLWLTEFGFSVHPNHQDMQPSERGLPTAERAATALRRAFQLFRENQAQLAVVYCAYRDRGDAHDRGYCLLNADGTAKPQLRALAHLYSA